MTGPIAQSSPMQRLLRFVDERVRRISLSRDLLQAASEVGATSTEDIERFTSALREAGDWSASLPPDVLVHLMNEDDKSAFIAWFEGRPNFEADDWSMLLIYLRELIPELFAGRGAQ